MKFEDIREGKFYCDRKGQKLLASRACLGSAVAWQFYTTCCQSPAFRYAYEVEPWAERQLFEKDVWVNDIGTVRQFQPLSESDNWRKIRVREVTE